MHIRLKTTALACLFTLAAATSASALSYVDAVLADGPAAYWQLNETSGTTVTDTISGRVLTVLGNPLLGQPGPRPTIHSGFAAGNNAVVFDGTGDALESSGANNLAYGAGDYSVELWFKASFADTSVNRDLFAGTTGGGHGTLLEIQPQPAGSRRLRFLHRAPTGTGGGQDIFFALPASTDPFWSGFHHVVGVKDDITGGMVLYLDGVAVGSNTPLNNFGATAMTLDVGRLLPGNATRDFRGTIDEVAIYTKALSAAQARAHFDAAFLPEPATLSLLGLAGMALLRRRRAV